MLKKLGLIATLSLLACQAQAGEYEDVVEDMHVCQADSQKYFGGEKPAATDARYDLYLQRNNDCELARGVNRKNANNPGNPVWGTSETLARWARWAGWDGSTTAPTR